MIYSKGLVYGQFWGGGEGTYPSIELQFETEKELIEYLNNLKDFNVLDSGMGFQNVLGGVLSIEEIVNEDDWTKSRDLNVISFGNLNIEQLEFCFEMLGYL